MAGTSTSATYGAPYNTNSPGQTLGPLDPQRWAGVRLPIDSANELVVEPLRSMTDDTTVTGALSAWDAATPDRQRTWANNYADALAATTNGDPAAVATGDCGPVPALAQGELTLALSGSLEGLLTTETTFYGGNSTKPLLLLADGTYLEDLANAQHLGGDQWGMMNGAESSPGQPWLWLHATWYQITPFASSGNADALGWGLMALLSVALVLLPWIPGLNRLPRRFGIHRIIWRHRWTASTEQQPEDVAATARKE